MSTTFPQRVADPFIQIWKGQQFTLLPILVKFSIETVTGFKKLLRECLDMKPEVDLVHKICSADKFSGILPYIGRISVEKSAMSAFLGGSAQAAAIGYFTPLMAH